MILEGRDREREVSPAIGGIEGIGRDDKVADQAAASCRETAGPGLLSWGGPFVQTANTFRW